MKNFIIVSILIIFTLSCKESNNNSEIDINDTNSVEVSKKQTTTENKPYTNGTFLCKINGKDWLYTKASGIVSTHKKTNKRTAIITFTKQLEKGKETVQLFYDGNINQLEKVTADIKQPKIGGGTMSAMYQLLNEGTNRLPDSAISGSIDLSNATSASGTATVSNMKIRFNEGNLEDETMKVISFSTINFSGIGYSDLDKF